MKHRNTLRSCLGATALVLSACGSTSFSDGGPDQDAEIPTHVPNPRELPLDDVPNVDAPNRDVPDVPSDAGVCPMGTTTCMSGCVNTLTDNMNCGGCNRACPGNQFCIMGACRGNCPAPNSVCGSGALRVCVDRQTDLNNCGICGNACAVANATPSCMAGACSVTCNMGFALLGGRCLVAGATPRPIAPISLGDTTLRRPTLRWELPAGMDGAIVELCRDRACTMVIETIRTLGTTARPANALAARSVVFWRMRGTVGVATSMVNSPVWLFHTPAVDASAAVDSSSHPHLDVNGGVPRRHIQEVA